jgi:hypothetical protein
MLLSDCQGIAALGSGGRARFPELLMSIKKITPLPLCVAYNVVKIL